MPYKLGLCICVCVFFFFFVESVLPHIKIAIQEG